MTTRDKVAQVVTIVLGDAVKMVVKKATTRVEAPPKRKHVQTLSYYLKNPRANIPYLGECLSIRFRKTNWVIAMKSLLTTHILILNSENDVFITYLSSRSGLWDLSGYVDRSSLAAVDMSQFVSAYSKFLGLKCAHFKRTGRDLIKKRKEGAYELSIEEPDRIFDEVNMLSEMLDAIFENKISFSDVRSSVLQTAYMFLVKEMLRVYSNYNNRIIFLLENIQELESRECKKLLSLYKHLCDVHSPVQSILDDATAHSIEGVEKVKLALPSESLVASIEDYVNGLVQIKGSLTLASRHSVDDSNENKSGSKDANNSNFNKKIPTKLPTLLSLDFDPSSAVYKLEQTYDPSNSAHNIDDLYSIDLTGSSQATGQSSDPFSQTEYIHPAGRNSEPFVPLKDLMSSDHKHGPTKSNSTDIPTSLRTSHDNFFSPTSSSHAPIQEESTDYNNLFSGSSNFDSKKSSNLIWDQTNTSQDRVLTGGPGSVPHNQYNQSPGSYTFQSVYKSTNENSKSNFSSSNNPFK